MGLFQHKKDPKGKPIDETSDGVQRFFDGYFEELKKRGNEYFESAVKESADQFKQDMDGTVERVNSELKNYLTSKLDQQFAEHKTAMKDAQEATLATLNESTETFQKQYQDLNVSLQKIVSHQQEILNKVFEESNTQIIAMKDAESASLQTLNDTVQALQAQHQQLGDTLQKQVASTQAIMVSAFQENMAQIIEHYLLEALGEQYDLKTQLPSIIKQMETNKQAIADDMKL